MITLVSDANGVAQIADWTIGGSAGINTLQEGLKAFPDNVEIMLMLAYAYLNTGQFQQATSMFESIHTLVADIEQASLTADFYILYASAYEELGLYDEMEKILGSTVHRPNA